MTIGIAILIGAIGAILAFAVTDTQAGPLEVQTIGFILIAAAVLGVILELIRANVWSRGHADEAVAREREREAAARERERDRPR
ncbi:MAG: hypothetical protein ACR2NA_00180 [Solirubrobacterales bacterium]